MVDNASIINSKDEVSELVINNHKLVYEVIKKNYPMDFINVHEREELYAEGIIGLLKAAQYFDKSKGFEFATYAGSMIYGYLRRYKREKSNTVRLPRSVLDIRYMYFNLARGKENMQHKECLERISRELNVPIGEVEEAINYQAIYLSQPIGHDMEGNEQLLESIIGDDLVVEHDVLDSIERKEKLDIYKELLKPKEFKLLEAALSGVKQDNLGKTLQWSQSYVSRMLKRITTIIAPAVNSYYNGEISYSKMKTMIKLKTREAGTTSKQNNAKKPKEVIKINYNSKEEKEMAKRIAMKDKFAEHIKVLREWGIERPYVPINISRVLKANNIDMPNGYSGRLRDLLELDLIERGYEVTRVDKETKQGGYYIMVTCKNDKNLLAEPEEVIFKPVVNNDEDATEECDNSVIEKLLADSNTTMLIPDSITSAFNNKETLFSINNAELTNDTVDLLSDIIENLQRLSVAQNSKATISITIERECL